MDRPICLVPSKEGPCTLLAGHTGFPHRTGSGLEWYEPTDVRAKPGRPRKVVA